MTPQQRAWSLWIAVSVLLAYGSGFLAAGLFGSAEGATIAFAAGVIWWASAPQAIRAIGRRWK